MLVSFNNTQAQGHSLQKGYDFRAEEAEHLLAGETEGVKTEGVRSHTYTQVRAHTQVPGPSTAKNKHAQVTPASSFPKRLIRPIKKRKKKNAYNFGPSP